MDEVEKERRTDLYLFTDEVEKERRTDLYKSTYRWRGEGEKNGYINVTV